MADQLAAYILTYSDEDYLITVADTYGLAAQRATNFLCYVYGSDTKGFQSLIDDGVLNKERAEDCEHEYQQIVDAWDFLLGPISRIKLKTIFLKFRVRIHPALFFAVHSAIRVHSSYIS